MSSAEEEHDLISFEGIKRFAENRLGAQAAKRALDKASKEVLAATSCVMSCSTATLGASQMHGFR